MTFHWSHFRHGRNAQKFADVAEKQRRVGAQDASVAEEYLLAGEKPKQARHLCAVEATLDIGMHAVMARRGGIVDTGASGADGFGEGQRLHAP